MNVARGGMWIEVEEERKVQVYSLTTSFLGLLRELMLSGPPPAELGRLTRGCACGWFRCGLNADGAGAGCG